MLLLFHLLISSIARKNPFSGCSHYLEASQVIYDANRLIGFSVMGISIERNFRAIGKTIFVSRILLLLPVLRLALIFLIGMVYLVFFRLYCFSTNASANAFPWSVQLFLIILLLIGKTILHKDAS